ncbi:MAG TPA: molybdopterin molybdenumtransferase MoeA, partial [Alphaproteobacteria bacterium]|nr:molybdopterin molybdenumtransferase MoeA [Alphaproteobacteria bacterium]
ADMVALQENATRIGSEVVIERGEVSIGKHVRKAGGDFKAGDVTLSEGLCLSARDIALLSAMNHANVEVVRKPRIGVLATGDELVRPGGILGPAQIVAASLDGLLAQIEAWGSEAIDLGIAPDNRAAILAAAVRDDLDALVTLGGASVGDHDLVKQALSEGGLDVGFWKIAMRPGKPLISGTFRGRPFLGLPGNPVSAMICALLFLKPAIFKALGRCGPVWTFGQRPLAVALPPNDEREDYLRARLVEGLVVPHPVQDSGQLLPLALADVLALRPPRDPAKAAGSLIDVIFLDRD